MIHTFIDTEDIFDIKDPTLCEQYFNACKKWAEHYHLTTHKEFYTLDGIMHMYLTGRKIDMVRYYVRTIFKNQNKFDGFKRLFEIIAA